MWVQRQFIDLDPGESFAPLHIRRVSRLVLALATDARNHCISVASMSETHTMIPTDPKFGLPLSKERSGATAASSTSARSAASRVERSPSARTTSDRMVRDRGWSRDPRGHTILTGRLPPKPADFQNKRVQ